LSSAIYSGLSKFQAELEKEETYLELELQNKKLFKINQELDSFVYSLSHNIRSPICSLIGIMSLMEKEGQNQPDTTNYLQMMNMTVSKLDKTINDIIEHSHNRNDVVVNAKIDLKALVSGVLEELQYESNSDLTENTIDVREHVTFYSDTYRITILLRNLLSNAIRYSDENKDKSLININIEVQEDECSITIEDNGLGIEKTLIPKAFDMFFRGNVNSQGAGLGLYIATEIVDRLGGSIELVSSLNEGTKVIIILPNRKN
jgi:Signal transduction histidine kinase